MSAKLKVKRGTTASWANTSKDTTLDAGQLGVEYRTGGYVPRIKVGTDVRDNSGNTVPQAWSTLSYLAPDPDVFYNQPAVSTAVIYPNGRYGTFVDGEVSTGYVFTPYSFTSDGLASLGEYGTPWDSIHVDNIKANSSTSPVYFTGSDFSPSQKDWAFLGSNSKPWAGVTGYWFSSVNPLNSGSTKLGSATTTDVRGNNFVGGYITTTAPDPSSDNDTFNAASVTIEANGRFWGLGQTSAESYSAKLVVESINTRSHVYGIGAYGGGTNIHLGTSERPWSNTYTNAIESSLSVVDGSTIYPVMNITARGSNSVLGNSSTGTRTDASIELKIVDSTKTSSATPVDTVSTLRWGCWSGSTTKYLFPHRSGAAIDAALGYRLAPWGALFIGSTTADGTIHFVRRSGTTAATISSKTSTSGLDIVTTIPEASGTGANIKFSVTGSIGGAGRTQTLTFVAPTTTVHEDCSALQPAESNTISLGTSDKPFGTAYVYALSVYESVQSRQNYLFLRSKSAYVARVYGTTANNGYLAPYHKCEDTSTGATLGNGTYKWRYLYAYSGTIQTSDSRDKDSIHYVTSEAYKPAMMSVAKSAEETHDYISTEDVVDFVKNLNPVTFCYRCGLPEGETATEDNTEQALIQLGLLADELTEHKLFKYIGIDEIGPEEIEPEEIDENGNVTKEAVYEDKRHLGLKTLPLVVTALTACKYTLDKLDELESRIAALESR